MRSRSGFTLVELLVVVLIIGMLMALLLPAVQGARERGRQTQCLNNLGELAKGVIQFETTKEVYPAYVDGIASGGNLRSTSFIVRLLPNLGRQDLWEQWRVGTFQTNQRLDTLVCPSDFPEGGTEDAPLSYVMNTGLQDTTDSTVPASSDPNSSTLPLDWAANGIGHCRYDNILATHPAIRCSQEDIRDGAQYTIMLSENIQAGRWDYTEYADPANIDPAIYARLECTFGMVWWAADPQTIDTTNPGARINQLRDQGDWPAGAGVSNLNLARPSSNHPDLVHMAYCDGHVASLREDIDYIVYSLLMTPDGRNARIANSNTSVGPPWTNTAVSDADFK